MDTTKLKTSVLKRILKLAERREALLSKLTKLEKSIASLQPGKPAASRGRRSKSIARKATAPSKRILARPPAAGRRGALKDRILTALRSAGAKGTSVKELSQKLGVKNQNMHVWFSTTGRKLGNIQKIGTGKYRWKA